MRFDNCFVTNSICGPCHAVIQTGKYSQKPGTKPTIRRTRRSGRRISRARIWSAVRALFHGVGERDFQLYRARVTGGD